MCAGAVRPQRANLRTKRDFSRTSRRRMGHRDARSAADSGSGSHPNESFLITPAFGYDPKPMPKPGSARWIVGLGCGVLGVAALAGAWETLASQVPGSPLYIGMLPGPIERLRETAVDFGVLLVLAGLLLREQSVGARATWTLATGTFLALATALYAALTGMLGVQLYDLRADAPWLFAFKFIGRALLCAGLAECAWLALRKAQ